MGIEQQRTPKAVAADIARVRRALNRLAKDLTRITRDITRQGGVIGLLKQVDGRAPKLSPALRQLQHVQKAKKTYTEILKDLQGEHTAMTVRVAEKTDEYAL